MVIALLKMGIFQPAMGISKGFSCPFASHSLAGVDRFMSTLLGTTAFDHACSSGANKILREVTLDAHKYTSGMVLKHCK